MSKINEILSLDLREDIKNVIDLEDLAEAEIQQEIESYIVTEGISEHFSNFITQYTSNIKETGVWISGFYGSGKSYFGKVLGYMIGNKMINGTSARERFIPRIKGVVNESLLENEIRKLDSVNSRVILLDIAKQNTENGLAFTLFVNFIKSLGFRDDIYGYMEYDLFLSGEYEEFKKHAFKLFKKEWDEIKKSNKDVARAMRKIYMEKGYSEKEYDDTQKVYSESINRFSAHKFKEEIEKYLENNQDETIVFIFDEASEAISQKKFSLLDLEGISEALSSISKRVWTIAIAQEKLDDVINNANVNRSQLIKVTDRFKTKIHLEATEVHVIIRNRLLLKKKEYFAQLLEYHKKNDGLISDATNLNSVFPTKTESAEEFATYYPFHKYQLELLQKFLFSSNALATTQIAARGMIITTFDVLRKQMRDKELFTFTAVHDICSQAQTAPPTNLGIKYDNATQILKNIKSDVFGEKLLKTIHFLSESELVLPTVENITKTYIGDLKTYFEVKPKIEEALSALVDAKILLASNNMYKITSDLEGKLLQEIKDFDVELYIKKRELGTYIKKTGLFNAVSSINDNDLAYKFNIVTDLDDDICGSSSKDLKFTVYSLFNINGTRQDFVETVKLDTQSDKNKITLVPNIDSFAEIDSLIGDIKRYSYMEDKYANDNDQNKRQIIREFSIIKEEKEKDLLTKIENSYAAGSLIYLFDEELLNRDSFKGTVNEVQRKLIKNIYTKRLSAQLSESIVPKLLNEQNNDKLARNFSGEDFKFFDSNGNFVGDHLKVVEEISVKVSSYTDGKSIEMDLSGAPWGYSFGTIVTTLAVLFRSGRLVVRYNGHEYFSFQDKSVHEVFTTGSRFKTASFKSITKKLTAQEKNQLVQILMDLNYAEHTGQKVDYSTNDFELADAIKILAEHFIGALGTMKDTISDFEKLFLNVANQKTILQNYSLKCTEANYIDKIQDFLNTKDQFIGAVESIVKAQKFIKKNFNKVKEYHRFASQVVTELNKADKNNNEITDNYSEFNDLYSKDIVSNITKLEQLAQTIKDAYFKLMKDSAAVMTSNYQSLKSKVDIAFSALKKYPLELNVQNEKKLQDLKLYADSRIVKDLKLEYSIECQNCHFTLSEIMNYIELAPSKDADLMMIQNSFVQEAPKPEESGKPKEPKKVRLNITNKVMTVKEYRVLLSNQLKLLAGAGDDEQVEINIDE